MLGAASGLAVRGVEGSEVVAPGMLASHYAPGKPVRLGAAAFADEEFGIGFGAIAGDYDLSAADRKSVVQGKRVSVRVDLGGRSIIQKKKQMRTHQSIKKKSRER